MSCKVRLTSEQIEDIVSTIRPGYMFKDVEYSDVENARENIRRQLKNVEIYPEKLQALKDIIEREYHLAQISPGECVGVLAASSIGEQNTQSSLNSFHQSGTLKMNLTGGMSRMNELMNATENTKTPSLTIFMAKEYKSLSLAEIRKIAYSQFIYVRVDDVLQDILVLYDQPVTDPFYDMFSKFYHNNFVGCKTRIRFIFDIEKLWLHKISLQSIVKAIEKNIECTDRLHLVWSPDAIGTLDVWVVEDNIADFMQLLSIENPKIEKVVTEERKIRWYVNKLVIPNIIGIHLSGIDGLKDCYYSEVKGEWRIDTKGGNLKKLLMMDCIDANRCKSNDMHDIFEIFGIEAVKQFLRDEYANLIKVNHRHLELLIDSMTVSGDIQRVTRNGIDRKQVGAIAKVSFEQPLENFLISASYAEVDPLRSVSGCITFGKPARIGTNYMDMVKFEDYEHQHLLPEFARQSNIEPIIEDKEEDGEEEGEELESDFDFGEEEEDDIIYD
jgi:DNA-directed RNA polymerase II subunit RPB1